MRVLVISNLFPPAFLGGYEIGAAWVCSELKRRGHEVMLWTASNAVDGRQDGFKLLHQPQGPDYRWLPAGPCIYGIDMLGGIFLGHYDSRYRQVDTLVTDYLRSYPALRQQRREQIENFAPDLVLTFNPACLLDPVFAELSALDRLIGVPSFALVSDDWLLRWRESHPLTFIWRHLQALRQGHAMHGGRVDRAFTALGDFLDQNGVFDFNAPPDFNLLGFTSEFLRRKSAPVLPAGVSTHIVHWGLPGVAAYPVVNPAAFAAPEPLRLAFCGQILPHKGLMILLQALRLTRRPHTLIVAGDDTSDYGQYCRSFVEQSGLAGRVEFTGKLPPAQVATRLSRQAEIMILPSQAGGTHGFEEPFSIVLLQGMAMGMAVIASRTGGSVEAIVDRESGRFFNHDQPAELAGIIDELDADRTMTRELAARGRARIEAEFTIEHTVDRLLALTRPPAPPALPTLLYAVRNATIDPANSGCVRVTRRLGRGLEEVASVAFAIWQPADGELRLLRGDQAEVLSRFNGPARATGSSPGIPVAAAPTWRHLVRGRWLIIPEILPAEQLDRLLGQARGLALRTAAIFYDSIALIEPDFCNAEIRANHAAYMRALAGCDLVIPISHFSERCLREFWTAEQVPATRVETVLLPGEFSGARLASGELPPPDGLIRILCVSTLEPRKNHQRLLAAFRQATALCPGLRLELHLVGNSYAGAMEITRAVEAAAAGDDRIRWWGVVDDQRLHELYSQVDFTVYPSLIEGFGLPILESIWHERPCVCSHQGVMAELAEEGGCLTVDVRSEEALARALASLATDFDLRSRLTREAARRPLKTWAQYTAGVLHLLQPDS